MSTVVLVQATPRLPATGELVTVRVAGGGTKPYDQLGFTDWRAGIASLPRFASSLTFAQGGFTGGAVPQTGAVRFFPSDKALLSSLANLNWKGAAILIATGDDEAASPIYATAFVGRVADMKVSGGAITFTLSDLSADLDKPVCPDTFAGTGDLEGGDDATGRIKRRTWGYAFNVEGFVLDKANSIYEFGDPLRPLSAFPMVKDKGREAGSYVDVAWQGTAAATLAALRAAVAPNGGCARAPSIAAVKWWTTPAGPLTADIRGEVGAGYVDTAPDIAARLTATYSTQITVGNLATAVAAQGSTAGVHCGDGSETVGALLDRLLLPVSLAWILRADGVLFFRRLAWTSPVESLRADTIERVETFQALKTRRLGFQRNYRQHSDGEISAALLLATDATYADGTPVEVLKPATSGATAGAPLGTTVGGTIVNGVVVGGVSAGTVADEVIRAPLTRVDVATLQSVNRQDARDRDLLRQAMLRLLSEADRSRVVMRDATIVVDPATGVVRIGAIDQLANRTSKVEVLLDAQSASIALKASVDYVNQAITMAQLPGQNAALDNIYTRLTSAEVSLSGALGQIALKADAVTVTGLSGTVTSLATLYDALAGVVSTKASQTVVDSLSTRVGSAEQTISALGNVSSITSDVRQARLAGIANATAGLAALLTGDAAAQRQIVQVAQARQELTTAIVDGLSTEAAARLALAARMGGNEAALVVEQITRADQFGSLSQAQTLLTSRVGSAEASVSLLLSTANGNEATAQLTLTAGNVITGFRVNGQTRTFAIQAQAFVIEGRNPFTYNTNTGVLKLPSVEVDTITVGGVGFNQLALGAAQRQVAYETQADITITRNASTLVCYIDMTKADADSDLRVQFSADIFSQDDFQLNMMFQVDGVTQKSRRTNMVFVGDNASLPFSPVARIKGVPAGARRIGVVIQNVESDNANLTVYAGALLEVVEVRKGSIGTATGGEASGATGGAGGGGGSGGGGYNGGGAQIP